MAFIQAPQRVVNHRKMLRLAQLLGVDRYAAMGRLVALWLWCLDNAPDGVLGDDVDDTMLADIMGWSAKMGDPFELVDALYGAGFIALAQDETQDETDDRWHLVGWDALIVHGAAPDDESVDDGANEEGEA